MTTPTAVLLIPGFFGYASFGPDDHPVLEYFAGVRSALAAALPAGHFIVTHEPPPTGSLARRVQSLHEAIGKLLAGELLPHGREAFKAERIHLVGHSTGGVDARLFANPSYAFDPAMTAAERAAPIGSLGNIVTLSSPLHGTPLASNITRDDHALLDAIRILTMLGVFKHGHLLEIAMELLKSSPRALLRHPLALPEALASSLSPSHFIKALAPLFIRKDARHTATPKVLAEATKGAGSESESDAIANQVGAFFQSVETDRDLLGDLTVASMATRTAGLAQTDYGAGGNGQGHLVSYVSVAPPPPRWPLLEVKAALEFEVVQNYIYATLYGATARQAMSEIVPQGPAVDVSSSRWLAAATSSDGVVPARSQTLTGIAAGVVLGDHLDVVGSFKGGSGANIMRSGSNFTKDRFRALWTDIARWLV